MSRHAAAVASPLEQRIADQFVRHATDLRFPRLADAALAAAVRILAEPDLAAGLRALPVLAAIDARHQPRTWAGSDVIVCAACQTAWPCPDRELLDRALPQTPAAVQGAEALPAAGYHLDTRELEGAR